MFFESAGGPPASAPRERRPRGQVPGSGVVQVVVDLGLDDCCVGLVVDRVEHGLDRGPQTLRNHCHQVSGVVGATALPGRSGQVRGDSLNQARVGVRGDKPHPRKSPGHQVGEQPVPGRRALGGGYPQS